MRLRLILASFAAIGVLALGGGALAGLTGGTNTWFGFSRFCDDSSSGGCGTGATATSDGDVYVEDALEVDGATDLDGTLAVAGAFTAAGAVTVTGALTADGGLLTAPVSVTDTVTLTAANCGRPHFVTAGIDTKSITLPALATVTDGCELSFYYVGADGGALLDISPNASDGIEGSCTLAASVVTFSGTDDADIGLTKATGLQGDTITITAGNAADWYVKACAGIWANN
jgi:hypothetical protein